KFHEVGDDEEEREQPHEPRPIIRDDEEPKEDDNEHRVVREEECEGREERRREPPPYPRHDGEHPLEGERVVLGGVDGGDGEDGSGGGKEGEEEEGEEVGGLEVEEGEPVGCEVGEEAALGVGDQGGGVAVSLVLMWVKRVWEMAMWRRKRAESGRVKAAATQAKRG
uniref:Uncharacterized protein n=1 Tax=Setaria italica TaxID=4555 RepID=K3Y2P5_SETIT